MELKLMPIDTVCDTVGVSPATLYRLIAAGRFPAPVKIGVRAARWRSDELAAHIDQLSAQRKQVDVTGSTSCAAPSVKNF